MIIWILYVVCICIGGGGVCGVCILRRDSGSVKVIFRESSLNG